MKNPTSTDSVLAELLRLTCEDEQRMNFVCNAISVYFRRLQNASPKKLVAAGLQAVVTPMVAELALQRVAHTDYSPAFLVRLISNDDVAALAWRAVRFYANRYAVMPLDVLSDEVGEGASDVAAAASTIHFMLQVLEEQMP